FRRGRRRRLVHCFLRGELALGRSLRSGSDSRSRTWGPSVWRGGGGVDGLGTAQEVAQAISSGMSLRKVTARDGWRLTWQLVLGDWPPREVRVCLHSLCDQNRRSLTDIEYED